MKPPQDASDFEKCPSAGRPVLDAEQLGRPGAARAEDAGAVGLVDHQPRAVGAAELGDARQRRDVALHGEDAVDDDEDAAARRAARSSALELVEAVVAEGAQLGPRAGSRRGSRRGRPSRR
jgi:hypothetical protein